ncbi:peroxiredoxin family protein [Desulfopila aestuarii]|nr:TlpA disulfide reductase family protein [Desulfopila aestuarii]
MLCLLLLIACQPERKGGPLMKGDEAPDFAAKDLDGNVIVLSSLAGKPVVLRFWETNCRFCRADTPLFNSYFEKYRDKGLHVVYVSSFYENIEAVKEFIDLLGVPFPVVMDEEAKLADLYNVKVYPQTFMIGPDRTILANIFGGVGEAEFQEILGKYLQ